MLMHWFGYRKDREEMRLAVGGTIGAKTARHTFVVCWHVAFGFNDDALTIAQQPSMRMWGGVLYSICRQCPLHNKTNTPTETRTHNKGQFYKLKIMSSSPNTIHAKLPFPTCDVRLCAFAALLLCEWPTTTMPFWTSQWANAHKVRSCGHVYQIWLMQAQHLR